MNIKESIEKFRNTPLRKFSNGEDVKAFQEYFLQHYTAAFGDGMMQYLHTEHKLFDTFFRMRRLDEIIEPNDEREYGAPAPEYCKKIGRANLPSHPVFYCSQSPSTAIAEMKNINGLGAKYALVKWKKADPSIMFKTFLTFSSNPDHLESARIIHEGNVTGGKEAQENMLAFSLFLGDEFLNPDDYTVSANFAHQILYTGGIEVLSYPSVVNPLDINFAFSTASFIQNKLVLDRVYTVEPLENNQLRIFQIGLFNGGANPEWYNFSDLDMTGEIFLQAKEDLFKEKV